MDLLSPSHLRQLLLSPDPSSVRPECSDLARLLAAYYLGLPLFIPQTGSRYPTLFLWTQYTDQEVSGNGSRTVLPRAELASKLPAEYGPALPVVLLIYCGLELEAILYSDHFNDRRSSLLLRMVADHFLCLSLTEDYLCDMRRALLDQVLSSASAPPTFPCSDRQARPTSVKTALKMAESTVISLFELDIVLGSSCIGRLEVELLERMEMEFAQLPLQMEQTEMLPRPPVYSLPEPSTSNNAEYGSHLRIHMYLHILLYSLHKSNRLHGEISRAVTILSNDSSKRSSDSLIIRLLLLVLSIIYRDRFSLAVVEQWSEVPEIAMKYKALISDTEEDDTMPYKRWESLANENDREHVSMFLGYLREHYRQETTLPPFNAFTREVWYKGLLERTENRETRDEESDWIGGILVQTRKVDRATLERLHFICLCWSAPSHLDDSLVSLRLALRPAHICSTKPCTSSNTVSNNRPCFSARDPIVRPVSPVEDKIFTPREDLVAYYARKGREYIAKKETQRKRTTRQTRYMRHTMRDRIDEVSSSQASLEHELDTEAKFLAMIPAHREAKESPEVVKAPPTKAKLLEIWDDAIRDDLDRLNKKLDKISVHLGGLSSPFSSGRGTDESGHDRDAQLDDDGSILEDLEEHSFDYDKTAAPDGLRSVRMERLDLSALSPLPSVGNRVETQTPEVDDCPSTMSSDVPCKEVGRQPWMRLIPLDGGEGGRDDRRILSYRIPDRSQTDRPTSKPSEVLPLSSLPRVTTDQTNFEPLDSPLRHNNTDPGTNTIYKPAPATVEDTATSPTLPTVNRQNPSIEVRILSREDVNAILAQEH